MVVQSSARPATAKRGSESQLSIRDVKTKCPPKRPNTATGNYNPSSCALEPLINRRQREEARTPGVYAAKYYENETQKRPKITPSSWRYEQPAVFVRQRPRFTPGGVKIQWADETMQDLGACTVGAQTSNIHPAGFDFPNERILYSKPRKITERSTSLTGFDKYVDESSAKRKAQDDLRTQTGSVPTAQIVVIFKSKEKDLATSIPLGKKFPRTNDIKSAPEFRDLASKVTAAMAELISAGSTGDLRDAKEIEKFERELNSRINRREEKTSSTTLEKKKNERDDFTQMDTPPGGQDDKNIETFKRSVYDKETSSSLARDHFDSFAQHHTAAIAHPETNDTSKAPDVSYVEVIAGHSDHRISAPIHEQTAKPSQQVLGPVTSVSKAEQPTKHPHEGPASQQSIHEAVQGALETLSAVQTGLRTAKPTEATSSSELLGPTKTLSEAISTESAIVRKATLIVDDLMGSVDDENIPDDSPSDSSRVNLDALMRTYNTKKASADGKPSTIQATASSLNNSPSDASSHSVENLRSKESMQEESVQGYREREDLFAVDSKLEEARNTIIELLEALDNDQKLGSELSLTTVRATASGENQNPASLNPSAASSRQVLSTASSPDGNVREQLSNLSYASPSSEETNIEPPLKDPSLGKLQESRHEPSETVSNVPAENTPIPPTDVAHDEQPQREREDSKVEEARDTIVEVLEAVDNDPQFDSQLNVATPLATPEAPPETTPETPPNIEDKPSDYLTPSGVRLPEQMYSTTSTQDAEEIVEDVLHISPSKLPVDSSSNLAIGPLAET